MAAFKVTEAPIASLGYLVVAANSAQSLAAFHTFQQGIQHGAGGLAQRDDEDALVAAAVGDEPMQHVAFEAQTPVEGGCNVAGLNGAGKDCSSGGVQRVECGIAGRDHAYCSFSQPASDDCIASR